MCGVMCVMGDFVLCSVQRWYLIAVWPPYGVMFGKCASVCCTMCCGGWPVCSVVGFDVGDKGAASIAAGLRHVPLLTSLEYVHVDGRV